MTKVIGEKNYKHFLNLPTYLYFWSFWDPYRSNKIVYCVAVVVRKHGGNFTIKAHFGVVNSTSHGPIKSEAKYEPWQAKIACPQVIEIRLQNGVKPYLNSEGEFVFLGTGKKYNNYKTWEPNIRLYIVIVLSCPLIASLSSSTANQGQLKTIAT